MKSSLKLLGAAAVMALCSSTAQAQLIISEVVDGTLSGGQPKFVEISNTSGAPIDMSLYQIAHYNNGGLAGGGNISLAPAGMLAAGASWVVAYGAVPNAQFAVVYGHAADQEVTYGGHNGDDAIALELIAGPVLVDVFGVIGCDPITTPGANCSIAPVLSACGAAPIWDYEDSYVYRCGVTSSTTFNPADWIIPGSDALEDCVNLDPGRIALMQANTTPGVKQSCNAVPISYCTAKITANACSPAMAFTGSASATAGSGFLVRGTNFINNKNCLLFYGVSGQSAAPFQGGTLCVKSQIKRTPGTNTMGNPPPNDCSGIPSIDMNLFAVGGLGGTPLAALQVAGTVVDCQWWGRDPGFVAPNNTQLSNGLEYTVGP
jgi:hypothetical protein